MKIGVKGEKKMKIVKNRFSVIILLCLFFSLIIIEGCKRKDIVSIAPETITVTEADNNKQLNIRVGDSIEIKLDNNGADGGYRWGFIILNTVNFDKVKEEEKMKEESSNIGNPTVYICELKAIKVGDTKIQLKCYQKFAGESSSIDEFNLKVQIIE